MSILNILRRPKRITPEEYLQKLLDKGLNEDGSPLLDPTPIAPPIGYKKQPSMVEIVRDMVRGEKLRVAALESGHETFEESEDFDIEEDPQLRSPHENERDPTLQDLLAAGADAQAAKKSTLPPDASSTPKAPQGPLAAPGEAPKPDANEA